MSRIMAVSNLVFGNESEADAWAEKNAPELVGKRSEKTFKLFINQFPLQRSSLNIKLPDLRDERDIKRY